MNKAKGLLLVNPLLFFSFVVQAATGILLFLDVKVPGGPLVDEVHSYNGLLMVCLTAIHLFLNRGWIKANFLTKKA